MEFEMLASRAFNTPLLLRPEKAEVVLSLIARRINGGVSASGPFDPARGRRDMDVVDGVAVIDVFGTLVHRTNGFTGSSGLLSYGSICDEVKAAIANDEVDAILLSIDSPGGEAPGVADLASYIRNASERKPIVGFVNDLAASAAYWLASACTEIYVSQSAVVGSIGVVMSRYDLTEMNERHGVKVHVFHAGAAKVDLSPSVKLTKPMEDRIQHYVDSLYSLFVAGVSHNRNLPEDAVRSTEAQIYTGHEGVDVGLADGVTNFDGALEAARDLVHGRERSHVMAKEKNETNPTQAEKPTAALEQAPQVIADTAVDVAANFPQAVASLNAKAITEERTRIASILDVSAKAPGSEKLARAAITEGKTAGDLAMDILEAQQKAGAEYLDGARSASDETDIDADPTPATDELDTEESDFDPDVVAEYKANKAVRAEFTLEQFAKYRELEKQGKIK